MKKTLVTREAIAISYAFENTSRTIAFYNLFYATFFSCIQHMLLHKTSHKLEIFSSSEKIQSGLVAPFLDILMFYHNMVCKLCGCY
jgi:hypothetical protein